MSPVASGVGLSGPHDAGAAVWLCDVRHMEVMVVAHTPGVRFALRHGTTVHIVHDRTPHLLHATTMVPNGARRSVLGAHFVAGLLMRGEMDITADPQRAAEWIEALGGDGGARYL